MKIGHSKPPTLVRWKPHHLGWIKINIDGARKIEVARAGLGFVARSSDSVVLAAVEIPVLVEEINYVELLAAWNAISWFYRKFGPSLLWLEGDNKRVIELLNPSSTSSSASS